MYSLPWQWVRRFAFSAPWARLRGQVEFVAVYPVQEVKGVVVVALVLKPVVVSCCGWCASR